MTHVTEWTDADRRAQAEQDREWLDDNPEAQSLETYPVGRTPRAGQPLNFNWVRRTTR